MPDCKLASSRWKWSKFKGLLVYSSSFNTTAHPKVSYRSPGQNTSRPSAVERWFRNVQWHQWDHHVPTNPLPVKTSVAVSSVNWSPRLSFVFLCQTCPRVLRGFRCKTELIYMIQAHNRCHAAQSRGWSEQRRVTLTSLSHSSSSPGTHTDPQIGLFEWTQESWTTHFSASWQASEVSYKTVFIRSICLQASRCQQLICEAQEETACLYWQISLGGACFLLSSRFADRLAVKLKILWITFVSMMPNKDVFTVSHSIHGKNLNCLLKPEVLVLSGSVLAPPTLFDGWQRKWIHDAQEWKVP